MGQRIRHYKALMRKNWILWKRALGSSICELVCPIALMALLTLTRFAVSTEDILERSYLNETAMMHQVWDPQVPFNATDFNSQLEYYLTYDNFYGFSNSTFEANSPAISLSLIKCRESQYDKEKSVIAYSPKDSIIAQKVVNQIEATLASQKLYYSIFQAETKANNDYQLTSTLLEAATNFIDFKIQGFDSYDDIREYLLDPDYAISDDHPGVCFGFSIIENGLDDYEIKIQFNDHEQDDESQTIPNQQGQPYSNFSTQAQISQFEWYTQYGFEFVHNWIANAVLQQVTGKDEAHIGLSLTPFAVNGYTEDSFSLVIASMLPFFMLLMYILPVYRTLQRILSEKQSRARESMRMMGLQDTSFWLSWFTYYFLIVTIISLLCTLLLSVNVITYSSSSLIFLYFWVYGMSLFGFIVFFQAFFSSARTGAISGTLVYFGTSFIDAVIQDANVKESSKIGASYFPTVAVARAANNLGKLEESGIGLNYDNVGALIENFRFESALIMMAISFITLLILGLYIENVWPSEYGIRKPLYFFLTKKFWCGDRPNQNAKIENGHMDMENGKDIELKNLLQENYEHPSEENKKKEQDKKILKIEELKKTFDNGFQAVKGINVRMFNGEIFALLGHNGAGKTTTISMLTGLFSSSSGSAEVFGYDLFNQMHDVRQFMGVCPQHDILFDLLTPYEHLQIFCDFKGVDSKTTHKQIETMLKEVDLFSSRNQVAKNLSGGQRRKLSVAIALIGDSKFVLLDEPTAGMDLTARRRLWNMLEKQKKNRIVILTTHYMDEADILGDRIGIMADGQLICLGSSLFLKNRFGVGYKLTMVKNNKQDNTKVGPYLQQKLGQEVKKLSEVSSEITYQIPANLSNKFKDFFDEFDKQLSGLDIRSYGISITTLEEVFLKVGHGLENENIDNTALKQEDLLKQVDFMPSDNNEIDNYNIAEFHEKGGCNVFLIHLGALLRKRYQIATKSIKGFVIEILVPILLLIIGFSFSRVTFFYDSPERVLEPSLLPWQQRILVNGALVQTSKFDITPEELMKYLPDVDEAFDITYKNYSGDTELELLQQFDEEIYERRKEGSEFPFRYGSYYVYEANQNTQQYKVATFANTTSKESTPLYSQFIYEAILKAATGNENLKFKVVNAPFPITQKLKNREQSSNGIFIVFIIGIGFALIPASIISFIVSEREKNLKNMQIISGMNLASYWVSSYIFDICKSLIPMVIAIGLLYAYGLDYEGVWAMFLVFPFGVIPFTYATSFFFEKETSAQTITIFIHFIFSGIGAIVVFILRIIDSTKDVGDILNWAFKVIPSFSLTNSILYSSSKDVYLIVRPDISQDTFDIGNIGGDIMFTFIHFAFGTIVVIILEAGLLIRCRRLMSRKDPLKKIENLELDEDVIEEQNRVQKYVMGNSMKTGPLQRQSTQNMQVCVHNFRKVYKQGFSKPTLAVENTSFGLEYGECFALLGVNGAGKTTTFKSLTNEIDPTSGQVFINGMNIQNQFNEIRKYIGYCPQDNAIFELMTVEEHLDYYARIKGILKDKRTEIVEKQIKEMNLEEHRKKSAGTLSGGNKRKLSVAMSIIGNPPIVLLDEPSAGMDPQARRFMWSVVAKISQQRKQSAVILTTHSMEEAEALSTKMGIMVKGGVMSCFGSSQHIKDKYGTGYEIEVKIKKITPNDIQKLRELFEIKESEEKILLKTCIEKMRQKQINEIIINEIRKEGMGHELVYESQEDKSGLVTVKNFLAWVNIELHGLTIIFQLMNDFKQVEMLEHYNDYYKFRVPKQDKSIGYLFGSIENQKEHFGISEYSVSQTTLEQIFQTFANQEIDKGGLTIFEKNDAGQITVKHNIIMQRRQSSIIPQLT